RPRSRRALRLDLEPQLRGQAGEGGPHPPGLAGDGRGGRASRPLRRRAGARRGGGGDRMTPFTSETGRVAILDRTDVDTDQIIPKQFLKRIERTGHGEFLFNDRRYDENGAERPGFELNRPEFAGASIL